MSRPCCAGRRAASAFSSFFPLAFSGFFFAAATLQEDPIFEAPPCALFVVVSPAAERARRGGAGASLEGCPLVSLGSILLGPLLLGPLALFLQSRSRRSGPSRDVPQLYRRGRARGRPGELLPLRRGGAGGTRGRRGVVHFFLLFFNESERAKKKNISHRSTLSSQVRFFFFILPPLSSLFRMNGGRRAPLFGAPPGSQQQVCFI